MLLWFSVSKGWGTGIPGTANNIYNLLGIDKSERKSEIEFYDALELLH